MDLLSDLMLSRVQFAQTTAFHILWSSLSVGLGVILVIAEGLWIKTGDRDYYRMARFWGRLFMLIFAVGVVTGIPLGFQFATNWARFSVATAGFLGSLLNFEATMAFMLEAAFLGVMLFGWNRVSKGAHYFSTIMVTFGASLSAFWIMAANAWMQAPTGGYIENGKFVITSYWDAVFNPDWFYAFTHMWVACLETALFVVGGISAWHILRNRHFDVFYKSFRIALVTAIVAAPLQFLLGDASGRLIAVHQPAKLAAIEAHWETNPPGKSAWWNVVVWPNEKEGKNDFEIKVPWGLSLLITHSFTGQVKGLNEFPPDEQPPVWLPFYTFRIMMGIGFGFIFLMLWTVWLWRKGRLKPEVIAEQKRTLWLWVITVPMGYIAIVCGWMAREIGRQPWTLYGLLRTSDSSTILPSSTVGMSNLFYLVVYTVIFFVFLYAAYRLILAGPEPAEPAAAEGEV